MQTLESLLREKDPKINSFDSARMMDQLTWYPKSFGCLIGSCDLLDFVNGCGQALTSYCLFVDLFDPGQT